MKDCIYILLRYISKYKYLLIIVLFLVNIVYWDENSLWNRYKHKTEIRELNENITQFQQMYQSDTEKLNELENNPKAIERIARERYFMKTEDEDIFIFQTADNETNR